jgi:hypothetical protein
MLDSQVPAEAVLQLAAHMEQVQLATMEVLRAAQVEAAAEVWVLLDLMEGVVDMMEARVVLVPLIQLVEFHTLYVVEVVVLAMVFMVV